MVNINSRKLDRTTYGVCSRSNVSNDLGQSSTACGGPEADGVAGEIDFVGKVEPDCAKVESAILSDFKRQEARSKRTIAGDQAVKRYFGGYFAKADGRKSMMVGNTVRSSDLPGISGKRCAPFAGS